MARRAVSGRAAILMYHRVARVAHDPFGIAVEPDTFRQHMELVAERYRPIALGELAVAVERGRVPDRAVAVTFDDGYADNLLFAKPILEAIGVPASLFVPTAYLGGGRGFWWDELARLVLGTEGDGLELRAGSESQAFALDGDREKAVRTIWKWVRMRAPSELGPVMDQVREWAGADGAPPEEDRLLSPGELVELASDGLVEVGAHTRTHPLLGRLPLEAQREEIEGGRRDLEAALGRPVRGFAYPFGEAGDYSDDTVRIVREGGFEHAVSVGRRPVTAESPLHDLPRAWVPEQTVDDLERLLARTLAA